MASYITPQAHPTWDQRWPHEQPGYAVLPPSMHYSNQHSSMAAHEMRQFSPQLSPSSGHSYQMMPASFSGSQYDSRQGLYQPTISFSTSPYATHASSGFDSMRTTYAVREPIRNTSPVYSTSSASSLGHHWTEVMHNSPRSLGLEASLAHDLIPDAKPKIKDVTPIMPKNPADAARYNTGVDVVMRSIQALDVKSENSTPATSPRSDVTSSSPGYGESRPSKPYACDQCPQSFSQKSHLKQHQNTHDGIKKFPCQYCPKVCSQKENLHDHMRAHMNRRDYKCQVAGCGKDFTSRGILNNHKKTHMAQRQRYACVLERCGKDFATPGNLKQHQSKFHQAELNRLNDILDRCENSDDLRHLSEMDAYLVRNLKEIHKNSNKGIKGRGKGTKVNRIHDRKCRCSAVGYGRMCETHMPDGRAFEQPYATRL